MGKAFSVRERGDSKLGCVVLIVLLSVFGYLCYRLIPVYLEREAFHEALLSIAGDATIKRVSDREIIQNVVGMSAGTAFQVSKDDIEIKRVRGRPEVFVIVNFRRTEEFFGYIHVFHFRYVAQGSLGF